MSVINIFIAKPVKSEPEGWKFTNDRERITQSWAEGKIVKTSFQRMRLREHWTVSREGAPCNRG